MIKKKRTVITEESHEVWIIRRSEDETSDARADEATDTSVNGLVSLDQAVVILSQTDLDAADSQDGDNS